MVKARICNIRAVRQWTFDSSYTQCLKMNLLNTQVLLLGVTGGVVGAWDSSFFAWTPAVGFSLSLYFVVFCGCALLC